jgi:hypothetical protein
MSHFCISCLNKGCWCSKNQIAVYARSQRVILSRFQLIYSKTATRAAVSRSFKLLGSYRLIYVFADVYTMKHTL